MVTHRFSPYGCHVPGPAHPNQLLADVTVTAYRDAERTDPAWSGKSGGPSILGVAGPLEVGRRYWVEFRHPSPRYAVSVIEHVGEALPANYIAHRLLPAEGFACAPHTGGHGGCDEGQAYAIPVPTTLYYNDDQGNADVELTHDGVATWRGEGRISYPAHGAFCGAASNVPVRIAVSLSGGVSWDYASSGIIGCPDAGGATYRWAGSLAPTVESCPPEFIASFGGLIGVTLLGELGRFLPIVGTITEAPSAP